MKSVKYIISKLGYGVGAVGLDLSYGMFYTFLAQYLTDVLGLKPMFLLILTPLARLWDGINDPMMGTIVDNTKTKMGKFRPWILTGALLNSVVLVLLFSNPFHLTGTALCTYVAIFYVGWGMTNTLADIPFWSMVPSFTSDPQERTLLSTVARAFSGIGQGIVSMGAPILMAAVSTTYDANGSKVRDEKSFFVTAVVCAVFLIFFASICVGSTKEKVNTSSTEKFSFKRTFEIVKSNDQLLVFMLFAMISNAGWYLSSGVAAYFFDVVVGDSTQQSLFSTFNAVGAVAGLLVFPFLQKMFSKRKAYQISLALAAFGFGGMTVFAFAGQILLMDIFYFVAGLGCASMFTAQTVFLADIVDYGEIKLGFRAESITFSMKGFLQKMAYTLQTIILFVSLGISKYDGTLHSGNSQTAKTAITAMLTLMPAILFAVSLVIYTKKFKLHGEFMDSITEQVMANRKEREAAEAE